MDVGAQAPTPVQESYNAAGESVETPSPVSGDAVLAGHRVTVAHPVSGDILAAGWRVSIAAAADDDVRAAGAELVVNGPIAGDLTIAGGDVTIGRDAHVRGRSWMMGRTVRADGVFERDVRIAGDRVVVGGEFRQPLRVVAQRLDIGSGARVLAPITYEGASPPNIASGAMVTFPVNYRNIPGKDVGAARWPRGLSSVVFGAHVFIGGLLLLLLIPRLAGKPAERLRMEPTRSLLAGLTLLVTIPFVAVLLVISIVGLPAGLALGAAYASALFLGVVTTALFIGDAEGRLLGVPAVVTPSRRVALLLAGVATLSVLRTVPVLGTAVVFMAVVFGLGALGLWLYRGYGQAPVTSAAQ
jgi:hypothetical protein